MLFRKYKQFSLKKYFCTILLFTLFSSAFANDISLIEDFDTKNYGCIYKNFLRQRNLEIVRDNRDHFFSGKVSYSGSDKGSERVIFRCPLAVPAMSYTLEFDVKFDENFEFIKGGKLHGLGPNQVMSGGKGTASDGWSARIIFLQDGGVGIYYYHQDQKGNFGTSIKANNFNFELNRYYRVRMELTLNSVAQSSDGSIELFIDDKRLIEKNGIRFRAVEGDEALITTFLFSTFHGGSTDAWAPKNLDGTFKTVNAYFDNFYVMPK